MDLIEILEEILALTMNFIQILKRTLGLIRDCFDLIEHITKAFTLEPGDIIATGTSSGVGVVLGKYLVPNDVVRIELENVGTLENKVVLEP